MDRKGTKLDPQGLFQKFCAGSCTRIKAHNNGIVVNILEVERSTHPKTEEERGVYKWLPDFQF